ncbi:hypothetical protein MNV49_000068 [Pseudohyphozyma bogoriensis]|nr:hypothetical protein MNV49_000068 [Pseudohyphozyma bogoriensis]
MAFDLEREDPEWDESIRAAALESTGSRTIRPLPKRQRLYDDAHDAGSEGYQSRRGSVGSATGRSDGGQGEDEGVEEQGEPRFGPARHEPALEYRPTRQAYQGGEATHHPPHSRPPSKADLPDGDESKTSHETSTYSSESPPTSPATDPDTFLEIKEQQPRGPDYFPVFGDAGDEISHSLASASSFSSAGLFGGLGLAAHHPSLAAPPERRHGDGEDEEDDDYVSRERSDGAHSLAVAIPSNDPFGGNNKKKRKIPGVTHSSGGDDDDRGFDAEDVADSAAADKSKAGGTRSDLGRELGIKKAADTPTTAKAALAKLRTRPPHVSLSSTASSNRRRTRRFDRTLSVNQSPLPLESHTTFVPPAFQSLGPPPLPPGSGLKGSKALKAAKKLEKEREREKERMKAALGGATIVLPNFWDPFGREAAAARLARRREAAEAKLEDPTSHDGDAGVASRVAFKPTVPTLAMFDFETTTPSLVSMRWKALQDQIERFKLAKERAAKAREEEKKRRLEKEKELEAEAAEARAVDADKKSTPAPSTGNSKRSSAPVALHPSVEPVSDTNTNPPLASPDSPNVPTPRKPPPKKGKKKRSAHANAKNVHHRDNYIPSRMPASSSHGNDAASGDQLTSWPASQEAIEAAGKSQSSIFQFSQDEWLCAFCEYELFFGEESMLAKVVKKRKNVLKIPCVFAYTLTFILIFLRRFNDLNKYPVVLTSAILVSIAGKPGVSVGACLDGGVLGMAGVGFGAVFFVILAKLGHSQVAQGFVFFVMLYFLALIKAQSLRYFAFSLLAIIMAFSGMYAILHCWGFAIVLGTNVLILPITSERELRELIVTSLEHISTLSHLIAKTYQLEITDEEREVRDQLNQSIRQDMAFLGQKMSETGLEINYTKWSMADYARIVGNIRQMQSGLITSHSSLIAIEKFDPATMRLIKTELLESGTSKAFARLRRGFDLSIADIVKELAVGKQVYHSPAPGSRSWEDFLDMEEDKDEEAVEPKQSPRPTRPRGLTRDHVSQIEVENRLDAVSKRLRDEVANAGATPVGSRRGSISEEKPASDHEGTTAAPTLAPSTAGGGAKLSAHPSGTPAALLDRVAFLRNCWSSFKEQQNSAIAKMLASFPIDDDLHIHAPGPSIHELYSEVRPTGIKSWASSYRPSQTLPVKRGETAEKPAPEPSGSSATSAEGAEADQTSSQLCGRMVMRVYSFIFGMGQLMDNLTNLHEHVVPRDEAQHRKKGIHVHFFERIPKAPKDPKGTMSLAEALATLEGREYVKPKVSIWERISQLEHLLRTNTSIYAFKTACAVSVYTVFILAPSLKTFFVDYGLTGGLITIVVAMAPTLGQTLMTFVLQICGTGFGSLFGMVLLYIFRQVTLLLQPLRLGMDLLCIVRHVGGYYFNPYGIVCLVALYAVPLCYVIYTMPMFFAGALLAMNGTGSLIVTEWVYREIPGQIRPTFDNPGFRAAKALVAMSLALGIAGIFQIFILRSPARQTLRQNLAKVTRNLGSYALLLSSMTEALAPTVAGQRPFPPDPAALAVVRNDLIAREGQIQMDILALMPLLKFGAAEPEFGRPFQAGTIARVIRTHQLILDRLREARTALSTDGFSPEIRETFTERLSGYRLQAKRFTRALMYICATSIATKLPLPSELPSMASTTISIQHDAMVLSHRLTQTADGMAILQSHGFLQYWFYSKFPLLTDAYFQADDRLPAVVSMSSVAYQLESLAADLGILFGDLNDMPLKY